MVRCGLLLDREEYPAMRAVQSFWFAPLKQRASGLVAGFQSPEDFLACWALSAMLLRGQFEELVFVSDSVGCALAAELELPYTLSQDLLSACTENIRLWNAGKFHAYLAQKQGFLHFDLDFLLWRALPNAFTTAAFCGQHLEAAPAEQFFYRDAIRGLQLLPEFSKYVGNPQDFTAINCGVFGGADIKMLHEYAKACLALLSSTPDSDYWQRLEEANPAHVWKYSVAIEQLLAREWMKRAGEAGQVLCSISPLACDSLQEYGFLHLVGHGKADRALSQKISKEVWERAPRTFAAIQRAAKQFAAR